MTLRALIRAAGAVACVVLLAAPAAAQDAYPSKPIKLIVPFPPSGGTDVMSRAISHAYAIPSLLMRFARSPGTTRRFARRFSLLISARRAAMG